MYRKIQKDFLSDEKCVFCKSGRDLKQGVILLSDSSETVFSSLYCLKKHHEKISNANEKIPDLTRGITRENVTNAHNSLNNASKKTEISEGEREENEKIKNIEYLLLRQERLPIYQPNKKYAKIHHLYDSYKRNFRLSESEEIELKNFCSCTEEEYPEYSFKTLNTLYAGFFWLEYAINKTKNEKTQSFLQSIFDNYKEYSTLTVKQEQAVQDTLKKINLKIKNEKQKIPSVEFLKIKN